MVSACRLCWLRGCGFALPQKVRFCTGYALYLVSVANLISKGFGRSPTTTAQLTEGQSRIREANTGGKAEED